MACRTHLPCTRRPARVRRSVALAALLVVWGAAPGDSSAASQLCEGGTHLLLPRDGGVADPSSALVFADRVCTVPRGVDPSDPIVMMPVEDLTVDVDEEPAALVPFDDFEKGWLWRIEPVPAVGAIVTISGCDAVERETGVCYSVSPETADDEGPLLQWSFTVEGEPEPVALVEPVIRDLRASGSTDPFSGEVRTLWSFTLERGQGDPGTAMLVDVTLEPGSASTQLPWMDADLTSSELVLGAAEGEDVCIEARTFDLYGNEGPTATACAEGGGGCSCRAGGSASGAMALVLLLLGLRRRHARTGRQVSPS